MTALIPEGLEPLAAWDARDSYAAGKIQQWAWWARDHLGRQLAADLYRVEFHLLDAPFAVAYRYKRDDGGHRYQDPATGDIAREDPVIVPLDELPPPHLLKG